MSCNASTANHNRTTGRYDGLVPADRNFNFLTDSLRNSAGLKNTGTCGALAGPPRDVRYTRLKVSGNEQYTFSRPAVDYAATFVVPK